MKKIIIILNIVISIYFIGVKSANAEANLVSAYEYNSSSCVTGEEQTCVTTTCYTNSASGSCKAGTIIKYKVNDAETKYFHVLHDDGSTLTMQQRENTVYNTAWFGDTDLNTQGPLTILPALEQATNSWTNVKDQIYTMGTTTLYSNAYTGCGVPSNVGETISCTTNTYALAQRTVKARIITVLEAQATGCKYSTNQSCPNWMNNYLNGSTSNGGTVNDSTGSTNYGYWTMSAASDSDGWGVYRFGNLGNLHTTNNEFGARAVVVIDKPITIKNEITNDNANTSQGEVQSNSSIDTQTVKIADTALNASKFAIFMGFVFLSIGIYLIVYDYKKVKRDK